MQHHAAQQMRFLMRAGPHQLERLQLLQQPLLSKGPHQWLVGGQVDRQRHRLPRALGCAMGIARQTRASLGRHAACAEPGLLGLASGCGTGEPLPGHAQCGLVLPTH